MVSYDTNIFSSLIDETSFYLGEAYRLQLMSGSTFPLVPWSSKSILLKLMMCRSLIDNSTFDTELCVKILSVVFDDKDLSFIDLDVQKTLESIIIELDKLSSESVLVKVALLHYRIVCLNVYADKKNQIADILSAIYLYKSHRISSPYFCIDSLFLSNKDNAPILSDVNNYILLFLALLCESAHRNLAFLEKVNKLKEEVLSIVSVKINRPQSNNIVNFLFSTPIFTADEMSQALELTRGQVIRHLHVLEDCGLISGDDKQRKRTFYFERMINICFEKKEK